MIRISEKIIQLRIATRRATFYETPAGGKNTLSLKSKILFLLKDKDLTPADIIAALGMAKTNLAILTSSMIEENLISKYRKQNDQRSVLYSIAPRGKEYINKLLDYIDSAFEKIIPDEESKSKYITEMSDIIDLISFL